jgi:hypothetical protein
MDFDFRTAAIGLAILSLSGIGVILAGSFLWQEQAERYKRMIPQILLGIILTAAASIIIGYFGG